MINKTYTIIGANSFLARNYYKYLIEYKHIDIQNIYLYDINDEHLDNGYNYQKIDFFDKISIEYVNFNCDYLYIFSGKTGTVKGFEEYKSYIEINEILLLNILDIYCKKKSKAKIVYPSTRLVYMHNEHDSIDEGFEKNSTQFMQ
ncbi:MAG: hypothetical protein RSC93_04945 [Erysipelotrichaceae bacterium]